MMYFICMCVCVCVCVRIYIEVNWDVRPFGVGNIGDGLSSVTSIPDFMKISRLISPFLIGDTDHHRLISIFSFRKEGRYAINRL